MGRGGTAGPAVRRCGSEAKASGPSYRYRGSVSQAVELERSAGNSCRGGRLVDYDCGRSVTGQVVAVTDETVTGGASRRGCFGDVHWGSGATAGVRRRRSQVQ